MKKIVFCITILTVLFACKKIEIKKENTVEKKESKQKVEKKKEEKKVTVKRNLREEILKEYKKWKGTKYKFGGWSKKGIDCSAYTMIIYKNVFKINLKRTTGQQMKMGKQVKKLKSLKIGDLLFFETKKNIWHSGVYIGNDEFTHASSSKGVTISKLSNSYWRKRYKKTRRFL